MSEDRYYVEWVGMASIPFPAVIDRETRRAALFAREDGIDRTAARLNSGEATADRYQWRTLPADYFNTKENN